MEILTNSEIAPATLDIKLRDKPSVSKMVPQIPNGYLKRSFLPRLIACLTHTSPVRLFLFSAPAGYGKTTALIALAQAYLEQEDHCIAWLPLSSEDNDSRFFFRRLAQALHEVNPLIGNELSRYLQQNVARMPIASMVDSLLNDLNIDLQPMLLVLDDLHLINNQDVLDAIGRLLNYAPSGIKVAIGARSQPSMGVATLRAKGLMIDVGLKEMQLSTEEIRAYFTNRGMIIDDRLLTELYEKTEGWMAGVHLGYLWLQQNQGNGAQVFFSNKGREALGRYLLNTVFEHLPEPMQQNLLLMSGATQLNASLVETLTGGRDGQALLEELEKAQLFLLPMDHERHWFRFHALFADFLHGYLSKQNPDRLRQQYRKACLWFAENQMPLLAVDHASLAGDAEMLGTLLNRFGLNMLNNGQLTLVRRWLPMLPSEIIQRYPILTLAETWLKALDMNLLEAGQVIDELTSTWARKRDPSDVEAYFAGMAIKAALALQKDDLDLCVEIVEEVIPRMNRSVPFLEVALLLAGAFAMTIRGYPEQARRILVQAHQRNHFLEGHYLTTQLMNVEVILATEQGLMKQAQILIDKLHEQSRSLLQENAVSFVFPVITESLIKYHRMELDGLEEQLRWALTHIDIISPIDVYAHGMICAARVQYFTGGTRESAATLNLMQSITSRHQSWRFYALALAEEIRIILLEPGNDRVKRAEQILANLDLNKIKQSYKGMYFHPIRMIHGLSRIRILQAKGHYSEALHEINQLRSQLRPGWHGMHYLRFDILAAISYQNLGYQDRAHHIMGEALAFAEREQVKSTFIEEGESVRELLKSMASTEQHPALMEFIRNLLQIWPGKQAHTDEMEFDEELTERERDVICLAAKGYSNEEISSQLDLALGTVKWHLHNIYQKLKVRNRTRAIKQARELNLI